MIGRIVSGLLTGNLAVLKSYVMEITDETNRGKGSFIYSLLIYIYNILLINIYI